MVEIRTTRNEGVAQEKLAAIKSIAATEPKPGENSDPKKNLLGLAIEAAKARCTVGEITQAMEGIWGRHVATDRMVSHWLVQRMELI